MSRFQTGLMLAGLVLAPALLLADDWPQFRGPGGQGQALGTGWPLQWSEQENVVWKVPLTGRGWSSPVVSGNQIWLTAAVDTPATPEVAKRVLERKGQDVPGPQVAGQVTLKAICVDGKSGRVQHDVTLFEVAEPMVIASANTYASPTPVLEAGRLYCDFGTMGTACLDADSGRTVWSRRVEVDHQVGPGSSPVVHGRLLILVRDGIDQQYLTALDRATGATVWKTERPSLAVRSPAFRKSFSTPLVIQAAGRTQLIATGARWIVAYEPATGQELWRVDTGTTFSNVPRPVYGDGLIFAGTSYPEAVLRAIRPDGSGDVSGTHILWQGQRSIPRQTSPLLAGQELYLVSDNGIASCLEARTGKVHWSQRLPGVFAASPVYAEGRVYYFGEDGRTTIVRSGTQYERLAENQLDGRLRASPAFVDHSIIFRTEQHLYRIGPPQS